jgi:MFS family permease
MTSPNGSRRGPRALWRLVAASVAVLIASGLQLFLIPAFGSLSDRVGRRPVYAVASARSPAT